MFKVNFDEYWNTFFCWAGEYKTAKRSIKTEAKNGYVEYCKHIDQEPIWK